MAELVEGKQLEAAETHHRKITSQAQGSALEALAAGRALLAAKAATPVNTWLAVLKASTSMNPRTVQRYMLLARAMDAGLLGPTLEDMSFSQAYRLAVRQAVRTARKSAAAAPGTRAARTPEKARAVTRFRRAARRAISAGVPFKQLERELDERIGAAVLNLPVGAAESDDEVEHEE